MQFYLFIFCVVFSVYLYLSFGLVCHGCIRACACFEGAPSHVLRAWGHAWEGLSRISMSGLDSEHVTSGVCVRVYVSVCLEGVQGV